MKKKDLHIDGLKENSRENPFKVPETYLETFEERLQARIDEEKSKPTKQSKVIRALKPAIGLVASFLVVFLLVYYPMSRFLPDYLSKNNVAEDEYVISIESLDDDEFYDLISEDIQSEEIDTDEMMEFLSVELSDYDIYIETYN